ncbi:MAG: hypothetical protein GX275_00800 [Clostridiales bacterium]|nr:hypothetical protein [Clostridiales bacterium]
MVLIIALIFVLLSLFYLYKYFTEVHLKKSEIEKNITFTSWVQYFFLVFAVIITPISVFNFINDYNKMHIIYFVTLIVFCLIYIITYRKLYCFNNYLIIAGKKIPYSNLTSIEITSTKNGKHTLISIGTNSLYMNIKVNKEIGRDFINYISTKIKFKILTK